MIAAKKLTAVAVAIFLVIGIITGITLMTQVHAEETSAVLPYTQFETGSTTTDQAEDVAAESDSAVALQEEEIPLAEAKASVLETQTEEKGMPSFLGFVLVAAAAGVTGLFVLLRVKLGHKKQSYVPAEDLTLFKLHK